MSGPIKVDENQPLDAGEPTKADIDRAARNYAAMSPETRSYLRSIDDQVRGIAVIQRTKESTTRMREYSDDEPRDDHGRWTGGGGSAGAVISDAHAGGGTIALGTGAEATTGYAVALAGHSSITSAADFFKGEAGHEQGRQIFADWLKANRSSFTDPSMHIGIWHDTAHDEVVLDPVQVLSDRTEAIAAGVARDQQAIYDLSAGVEIPTGGTGQR